MNKHTRSVSLIDGHIEDERGITDTEKVLLELKSASEWFAKHGRNTNTAIIGICNRAVDLINLQQAEIKDLQKIVAGKQKMIDELSQIITDTCEDCKVKLDANKVRVEAIKEFAEGLKDSWYTVNDYDDIDNLVKEMTEVSE